MICTAIPLKDWEVALFGFFIFVLLVMIIVRVWRDPTLRKIRFGVFVERERQDDYGSRPWPHKPEDEPTLHDWKDPEDKP